MGFKATIDPESDSGVIYAHGDAENGWSVYLDGGMLTMAAVSHGKREVIAAAEPISGPTNIEAAWSSKGDLMLKIDKRLVAKGNMSVIASEPDDTIQIGADLGKAIGGYEAPNAFKGTISGLSFKYPNGS